MDILDEQVEEKVNGLILIGGNGNLLDRPGGRRSGDLGGTLHHPPLVVLPTAKVLQHADLDSVGHLSCFSLLLHHFMLVQVRGHILVIRGEVVWRSKGTRT